MLSEAYYSYITYRLKNIEKLPYPEGIFWEDPGFPPSIGVPYGIARDFFYSGHTGFMLFCCIYWGRLKLPVLAWFSRLGLVFVILVLLATRVHYIIDVVAAVIFSLQIDRFLLVHSHWFDKLFTVIYNLFMVGANKVRQLWQ